MSEPEGPIWDDLCEWLLTTLESELTKSAKLRVALALALYYIEGDATWEAVKGKIDEMLKEEE